MESYKEIWREARGKHHLALPMVVNGREKLAIEPRLSREPSLKAEEGWFFGMQFSTTLQTCQTFEIEVEV